MLLTKYICVGGRVDKFYILSSLDNLYKYKTKISNTIRLFNCDISNNMFINYDKIRLHDDHLLQ